MSRFMRFCRFVALVILGAGAVALLAGTIFERRQRAAARRAYPPPGRMVDVGGHRLHIHCAGSGSPTIVLEAGQDVRGSLSWTPIFDDLATDSRVCAYDRAGIQWSEPGPKPRTAARIAAELAELLRAAGEPGPYVLVGHSLGAVHVRAFADLDRSAVTGMVLVDPSHPEQLGRLPSSATAGPPALVQALVKTLNSAGLFRFVSLWPPTQLGDDVNAILESYRPYSNEGLWAEFASTPTSLSEVEDSPGFAAVPLVVLTAGMRAEFVPDSVFSKFLPTWMQLHEELATLSTNGEHQVVPDATHYIHVDRPDAVISSIRRVLSAARQDAPSTPPDSAAP